MLEISVGRKIQHFVSNCRNSCLLCQILIVCVKFIWLVKSLLKNGFGICLTGSGVRLRGVGQLGATGVSISKNGYLHARTRTHMLFLSLSLSHTHTHIHPPNRGEVKSNKVIHFFVFNPLSRLPNPTIFVSCALTLLMLYGQLPNNFLLRLKFVTGVVGIAGRGRWCNCF